jgi:predicted SprT family Zn-dependent metalloprotease
MSFTNLGRNARKSILLEAKRQRARNTCEFREDDRSILPGTSFKSLYMQLNRELFDSELPDIPVVGNGRLRRTYGKAFYRIDYGGELVPTKIEMRTRHRWTDRFKRKVMTHEMCHIWAYQFHNEGGHGKMFWKKMAELGYPKFHDFQDSQPWERDIYC